jgi:hypothetical protein
MNFIRAAWREREHKMMHIPQEKEVVDKLVA